MIEPLERAWVQSEIRSAKWFVWHGKGGKSVARIKALDDALRVRKGTNTRRSGGISSARLATSRTTPARW